MCLNVEWAEVCPWLRLANPKVQRKSPVQAPIEPNIAKNAEFCASTPSSQEQPRVRSPICSFRPSTAVGKMVVFPKKHTIFAQGGSRLMLFFIYRKER